MSKPWGEVKSATDSPAKEKALRDTGTLHRISCSDLKRFDVCKIQQRVWEKFIYIPDKFGKEVPEGLLALSKGFL